jgi:aspartyl-tRNA(Asn)/glutamyl-tRNA(Gln) amidotransferase subunit B
LTYEAVIGLEVHAELATRSKMFCGCEVVDSTQAAPNTRVCPICAGLPGSLPVINQRAVEYALRVALALNCAIPPLNVFARKNYFYPDQPKGYQISQYELPLGVNGWIEIETAAGPRRVRIRRVHLEEDTGKLFHAEDIGRGEASANNSPPSASSRDRMLRPYSLVDLNRAGVPLLEIVTEPDLHTPEDVRAYGIQLRAVLRYLGVNSGDMEKGVIRFEPNISVRPAGSAELRTRTELKNLNSFRALVRGTQFEIERQIGVWQSGGQVRQETLGWDEAAGRTVPQRGKEHAHDYRYFPEPDLPPLLIDPAWVEQVRAALPELPAARRARFEAAYGLSRYDAELLVEDPATADYFERAVAAQPAAQRSPKAAANWITGELFRLMNQNGQALEQVLIQPEQMAELVGLVAGGALNLNTAKSVFEEMYRTGRPAGALVAEQGLAQVSDSGEIQAVVAEVIAANPAELAAFLAGKASLEQWFFGQIMRRLRGRGNPQIIRQALAAALEQSKPIGKPG